MTEDRYEIRGKIGQGGLGSVYRAWDRRLNRTVAIKRVLLDQDPEQQKEAVDNLLREASALSSVQHPHIVTVYDAGVDEDGPYVVMELLDGRTLDEMIEVGPLTLDDFREVAVQTQEALIAAQELDLVHRDLKPTNVMVTWLPSGKFQMKLVDFGLAKFSPKPSLQTIDHGDAVFGSIHFMAPEQFERTPLDRRTDIYSMGCIYYYALTSQYPFDGESAADVMTSHLKHYVTPLEEVRPDLPAWLVHWVMWHIERKIDDRPPSARESLQKFLMSERQSKSESHEPQPSGRPGRPKLLFPGNGPASAPESTPPPPPTTPVMTPVPMARPHAASPAAESTESAPPPPPPTTPMPIQPPPGHKPSVHSTPHAPAGPPAPAERAEPPSAEPAPSPSTAAAAPPAPPPPPQTVNPPVQPLTSATASSTPAPPPAPGIAPGASPPPAPPAPAPASDATAEPAAVISEDAGPPKRKGLSNAVKITIAASLAVAIIIMALVTFQTVRTNRQNEQLNALLAQVEDPNARDLPTNAIEARLLLSGAVSLRRTPDREAFYQRLLLAKSSDGTDLDKLIAEYAANDSNPISPDIRKKLFRVLRGRRGPSALPFLIRHAQSSSNPETATAALDAARRLASPDDLAGILNIIQFTDHLNVRQAAKATVASIVERSDDPAVFAAAIEEAYERATSDDAKRVFLELLGVTGAESSAKIIHKALEDTDKKTRIAAIAALGRWPDDSQFQTLLDHMAREEDDTLHRRAFDTGLEFLGLERQRNAASAADMWKALANQAGPPAERLKVITGLANFTEDWAFTIVESFKNDENDDVSFRAERALEHMSERRDRLGN